MSEIHNVGREGVSEEIHPAETEKEREREREMEDVECNSRWIMSGNNLVLL